MEIVSGKLVKFIVGTPIIGDWLMLAFYPNKLRKGIQAERKLRTHVPRISDQQERELRHRGFVPAVLSSMRELLGKSQQEEHNASPCGSSGAGHLGTQRYSNPTYSR